MRAAAQQINPQSFANATVLHASSKPQDNEDGGDGGGVPECKASRKNAVSCATRAFIACSAVVSERASSNAARGTVGEVQYRVCPSKSERTQTNVARKKKKQLPNKPYLATARAKTERRRCGLRRCVSRHRARARSRCFLTPMCRATRCPKDIETETIVWSY